MSIKSIFCNPHIWRFIKEEFLNKEYDAYNLFDCWKVYHYKEYAITERCVKCNKEQIYETTKAPIK